MISEVFNASQKYNGKKHTYLHSFNLVYASRKPKKIQNCSVVFITNVFICYKIFILSVRYNKKKKKKKNAVEIQFRDECGSTNYTNEYAFEVNYLNKLVGMT